MFDVLCFSVVYILLPFQKTYIYVTLFIVQIMKMWSNESVSISIDSINLCALDLYTQWGKILGIIPFQIGNSFQTIYSKLYMMVVFGLLVLFSLHLCYIRNEITTDKNSNIFENMLIYIRIILMLAVYLSFIISSFSNLHFWNKFLENVNEYDEGNCKKSNSTGCNTNKISTFIKFLIIQVIPVVFSVAIDVLSYQNICKVNTNYVLFSPHNIAIFYEYFAAFIFREFSNVIAFRFEVLKIYLQDFVQFTINNEKYYKSVFKSEMKLFKYKYGLIQRCVQDYNKKFSAVFLVGIWYYITVQLFVLSAMIYTLVNQSFGICLVALVLRLIVITVSDLKLTIINGSLTVWHMNGKT